MTEPEEPDFDFDAHIAELIARRCSLLTKRIYSIIFTSSIADYQFNYAVFQYWRDTYV